MTLPNTCVQCGASDPLGIVAEQERIDQVEVARIQAESALALQMESHRHEQQMAGVYHEQSAEIAEVVAEAPPTETEAAIEVAEAIADAIEGTAEAEAEAEIEVAEIQAETEIEKLPDDIVAPAASEDDEDEKPKKSFAGRLLA